MAAVLSLTLTPRADDHVRLLSAGTVAAHDPRERRHPHDGSGAADGAGARDRSRSRRRGRRHARDGAAEPGRRRPRRPLRAARLHGLARALPDVVALPARREARGRLRPRGGARARARASATRHVDPRDRLALGGVGGAAHGRRPRCGDGRRARAALLQGLPLGLAQHGGARTRDRRPPGRRWRGRAGRERRADRDPARGVRVAVPRALRDAGRGRVRRRHPRGSPHRREPRRRRDPRQGRVARRAAHLPADRRARRAHAPRVAVRAVRAPARARGADACARASATTSSASGT